MAGAFKLHSDILGAGNVASRLAFKDTAQVVYAMGAVSGPVTVDLANGNVQSLTATGQTTFTFSNWPAAGRWGIVLLLIADGANLGSSDLDGINWFLGDGLTSTVFLDMGVRLSDYNEVSIWTTDGGATHYGTAM